MTWGTSSVLANTRSRLMTAGMKWTELPVYRDIDEVEDLVELEKYDKLSNCFETGAIGQGARKIPA